jgi:hypothetical protein
VNDYDDYALIAWDAFFVVTMVLVASANSTWLASEEKVLRLFGIFGVLAYLRQPSLA